MAEETYDGLEPAGPWPGGRLWTARNAVGDKVFLREAGRAEAGAAPFLSHPVLPICLGEGRSAEVPGASLLVYEYFDGRGVGEYLRAGGVFTQFDALKVAYDVASALKYLHGLSPRMHHGAVSADAVFRAGGGRALLCGFSAAGDTAGDLKGLAGLMRAMAAAPKSGAFSPGYRKIAEQLELPGAEAAGILKAMESLAAGPGYLPPPPVKKEPFKVSRSFIAAVAGALLLYGAAVYYVEKWPQHRSERNIKLETRLNRDYPCLKLPPPGPPALGANLLKNPGLEGACGWRSWGGWERGMMRRGGAQEGMHYVEIPAMDYGVWQDADVSAFAPLINAGSCRVRLGGWLRAGGSAGSDGYPYLFGYAMRSENDYSYLSGFEPVTSGGWTHRYMEWSLPSGTRRVRVILQKSSRLGSFWSHDAYFDNISAEVRCGG